MSTCQCCIPLTGEQRCYSPEGSGNAEDQPWVIAPGNQSATKVVNGVTITATVTAATGAIGQFFGGCPAGACDPNALSEQHSGQGNYIEMSFDATVFQPVTRIRVIDFDNPSGGIEEQMQPQGLHNVPADINTPLNTIPGGNAGGVQQFMIGSQVAYRAPSPAQQRSAALTWNNVGWGGGQPFVVRYRTTGGSAGGSSASQYDFFGEIENIQPRATAVLCGGEIVWRDVYTGVVLTQAQIDSFTPCTD